MRRKTIKTVLLIRNYFNEVVCKTIELLVTCKLVISALNFRVDFRYDQEGNVLLRSAVIHLKQDGRRSNFLGCHFLDLSSFFYLSLAFP